jgi:hypothetical protein
VDNELFLGQGKKGGKLWVKTGGLFLENKEKAKKV